MARFVLTAAAKADLKEIVRYIAASNTEAARKVHEALQQAMKRIAAYPAIGHLRPDLAADDLRVWSVYSYLIIYRQRNRIEIVRILHAARDVRKILSDDSS